MSNTGTALLIGTAVLTVGGVIAYWQIKKRDAVKNAPVVSMPGGAGTPSVAEPAHKMDTAEALAIIGGKALQEGIKYAVMGTTGYAASLAGRSQKQG